MKAGQRWRQSADFTSAGRSVGVVLDHLPDSGRVQQAVEATVETDVATRVGWLLARQLDRWPWPRQRRPPVRIRQYAIDRQSQQRAEAGRQAVQLSELTRRQDQRRQRQVAMPAGPRVQVEVAVARAADRIPGSGIRVIIANRSNRSHLSCFEVSAIPFVMFRPIFSRRGLFRSNTRAEESRPERTSC
jgi:hypothetical protein